MKSRWICFVFAFFFIQLYAQENTKIYLERKSDTVVYYVDNYEIFPCTIEFGGNPVLENAKIVGEFKKVRLLPAKSYRTEVARFVQLDKKKGWAIKSMPGYTSYFGDIYLKSFDVNYVYDLPFSKGGNYLVGQGYNGKFSHQNEFAIDFNMPLKTEILAARDGIVVKVVDHNTINCVKEECKTYGNFVRIYHPDGTLADYYHLDYKGAKVQEGQAVKKGELIALSGNTGFSNGPHLHFSVFVPTKEFPGRRTLKTLFKTGDGTKQEYLSEMKRYSRNY